MFGLYLQRSSVRMNDRIIVRSVHSVEYLSHLLSIALVMPAFSVENIGEVKLYTRDWMS